MNQEPHPLFAWGPAGSAGQGDRGQRAALRPETAPQPPAQAAAWGRGDSREGHGEVEALPQAPEGDEGLRREAPGGHLAVGPLELARGAHAVEAADEQVHAGAPVLAHAVGTAAGARVHLTVLTWGTERERGGHTAAWVEGCRGGTGGGVEGPSPAQATKATAEPAAKPEPGAPGGSGNRPGAEL